MSYIPGSVFDFTSALSSTNSSAHSYVKYLCDLSMYDQQSENDRNAQRDFRLFHLDLVCLSLGNTVGGPT